jgi:glycerophosphoryl diester phosphodiesterase
MNERVLRRVGHKGADGLAPGNTDASFDAALAAGVDMIEFDVVPEPPRDWAAISAADAAKRSYTEGRLLLAHDWHDASTRAPQTLEQGLDHLASERFAGIELDIDLKLPGYELRVVEALRETGLLGRALLSSQYRESLRLIRRAEPSVRLGWSVPKLTRDPFRHRALLPFTIPALLTFRAALPARAARAIRGRECDAIMAHWRLVTPGLLRAVRGAGGELYVWTVDERPLLAELQALGVDGVITNDPRLFAPAGALAP